MRTVSTTVRGGKNSDASYQVVTFAEGGAEIIVVVQWHRDYGKCDRRTYCKRTTIYTRRNFRAWLKRNGMTAPASVIEMLG